MLEKLKTGLTDFSKRKLKEKYEVNITISIYFYTNLGVPVAPAALPVEAQNQLPCYLFGLNDFKGGFNNCRRIVPVSFPWFQPLGGVIQWGIYQYSYRFISVNAITNHLERGDMVFSYRYDFFPGQIRFCFLVIHCDNVAYGTFLHALWSEYIVIDQIKYTFPIANINQLDNTFTFGHQTLLGVTTLDTVDPKMFTLASQMQPNIVEMPVELELDKGMFLAFNINVFCPFVNLTLFVSQYEAMTYKQASYEKI